MGGALTAFSDVQAGSQDLSQGKEVDRPCCKKSESEGLHWFLREHLKIIVYILYFSVQIPTREAPNKFFNSL